MYVIKARLPKLTENQKLICDVPITLEERKNALNYLHRNKFDIDGFATDFSKAFWNDIEIYLFD